MSENLLGARREFLIRVHQQVWYAGSRAILPLLLITYGVHAVTRPCWQATALLLVTVVLVVCWYLSWRNAREGLPRAAVVALTSSSALLTVMGINATLEAARAGEAGVGFRGGAGELQKLAAQTTADLHQANQILEHLRARAAIIAQDADAGTADLPASYERLVSASALLEGITTNFESASKSVEGIAGRRRAAAHGHRGDLRGHPGPGAGAGKLSDAGRGLREGLERVEGAHGQLRESLSKQ